MTGTSELGLIKPGMKVAAIVVDDAGVNHDAFEFTTGTGSVTARSRSPRTPPAGWS